MPWPDLSAHELTAIRRWAEATPRITEIRLFGSRAKGRARPDSDIDLAITVPSLDLHGALEGELKAQKLWKRELIAMTGRRVSLVFYSRRSAGYEIITSEGIVIWPCPATNEP